MAKNLKQIVLMQQRRGKLSELPTQLNEAELGFATDTNELFIGNPNNPALKERVDSNTFPYGNVQILTEFTDNLQKIKYTYQSNTGVIAKLPIVIHGSKPQPTISAKTSLIINNVEVKFTESSSLNKIVETINATQNLDVKAFNYNNYIGLITTGTEITLENGATYGEGIIQRLGFSEDSFYSATSTVPTERTLQEVLDDTCSVKNYGALGDGQTDDSQSIYNAIVSLNKAGNEPKFYRTLTFPAGTYILASQIIPLPFGTHLKGEGMGRTVLKTKDFNNAIMMSMDSNMNVGSAIEYGMNADKAGYITVEDLTIDVSESISSSLLLLQTCHNVLFKNVEFIGTNIVELVRIADNTYISGSEHICFDGCIFNNAERAITSYDDVEHLVIKNCIFKNVKNEAILLTPNTNKMVVNTIIDGNIFNNCGNDDNSIIKLGDKTEYISVVNNKFDGSVSDNTADIKAYETLSDKNYTDILDAKTDTKKVLQFKFTQPVWAYIDYLMNPNGEYLIKPYYNIVTANGQDYIRPLTNGLIIEQGDESNNNTVTITSSNPIANMNITSGKYNELHIGTNVDSSSYNDWLQDAEYKVGDRVQVQQDDGSYQIYECIQEHVATATDNVSNTNLWSLLGQYTPQIVLEKNLNLNGGVIKDDNHNINFKATNDNILIIDDSEATKLSYAERIPSYLNAIPNVEYVNTIAQTTIRDTVNDSKMQLNPTNRKKLVYFDPSIYGDFINMNYINMNVRRPYYPIVEQINENTKEWKPSTSESEYKYYIGDVIRILEQNPSDNSFKLYIADANLDWVEINSSNILKPTDDNIDGNGKPLPTYGNNGQYAFVNFDGENLIFVKKDNKWLNTSEEEYIALNASYAQGLPNKTYQANSIVSINGVQVVLSGTTIAQAIADINGAFSDGSVVASNVNNALRITSKQGLMTLEDIQYAPLESLGFTFDNINNEYVVETSETIFTFALTLPTALVEAQICYQGVGAYTYYVCTETHIATQMKNNDYNGTFDEDAGRNDPNHVFWREVYKTAQDADTELTVDVPDVKYISIYAESADRHEHADRLLFNRQVIDVARRNINSLYYPNWETNVQYTKDTKVKYNGRYWNCLKDHLSVDEYDINNPQLWSMIVEEGYNYHFDFERDLYKVDENGVIVTDEDITIDYNFANYTLYLEFYDKNGNLIPEIVNSDGGENDNEKGVQTSPAGYILTTINYIRGQRDED